MDDDDADGDDDGSRFGVGCVFDSYNGGEEQQLQREGKRERERE